MVIAFVAGYVFQILRTHAVCGSNRLLTAFLIVLVLPSVGIYMLEAVKGTCIDAYVTTPEKNVQIASDLAFETAVFCVTVWRTWSMVQGSNRAEISDTAAHAILQNGAFYYFTFVALQVIMMAARNVSVQTTTLVEVFDVGNLLNLPIRLAILCKFMMDLRGRIDKRSRSSGLTSLPATQSAFHATINFVQGSIYEDFGEALYPPTDDYSETSDEPTTGASEQLELEASSDGARSSSG